MKRKVMIFAIMLMSVTILTACTKSGNTESVTTEETETIAVIETETEKEVSKKTPEELAVEELGIELQEGDTVTFVDDLFEEGYEIQHADGTCTYDFVFTGINNKMHARVSNILPNMKSNYQVDWDRAYSKTNEDGSKEWLQVKIEYWGKLDESKLNFDNYSSDAEFIKFWTDGSNKCSLFEKIEEEDYTLIMIDYEFRHKFAGDVVIEYAHLINNHKTNETFAYKVSMLKEDFDEEYAKSIIDTIEIFENEDLKNK